MSHVCTYAGYIVGEMIVDKVMVHPYKAGTKTKLGAYLADELLFLPGVCLPLKTLYYECSHYSCNCK